MGYSNFKDLREVTQRFGLKAQRTSQLFNITPVEASEWLKMTLKRAELVPLNNEKVKSERIVSNILLEVAGTFREKITLFSGESLEVTPEENLNGPCDFFFVLQPNALFLESPVISLAEAKNDNLSYGIAQCAAQLYGAKLFNEREGKDFPVLYGCTTTGTDWQFLCFKDNTFFVDAKIYTQLEEILGVWNAIILSFLESPNQN